VINFYQINNFADQMINQFQSVSVNNAGANSTLNVVVDANSLNKALL
jgi:RNase adaptor protein for sRNA GlmZ degradation